jgi:L-alanine-DL-glutamate epimerase-like enolase superfamily enzyme
MSYLDIAPRLWGREMRIDLIEYVPASIPRKERFTIARGSSDVAENLFVSIHSGGLAGTGCGAPSEVTKETLTTMQSAVKTLAAGLEGYDFRNPREATDRMDTVLPGNPAAKAAIDIAMHDLAAQVAGQPLYAYLGGTRDRMATDMTIGIMGIADAVERAHRWTGQGFRSLKIKVGTDPRADLERLRAIRGAVGPGVELRVDGNQGYTWTQALHFARAARDLNVALFEQPVSATDYEGMRTLRESSPIPIMADEMVLTPDDVKKLRWSNAAHAVNLKLMKHGGIARAIDVNTICETAGYPTMVGCMGEPQLSIAAGLHFALAQKNVRWLDLDSHFNLARDPTSGLVFEHGELVAPKKPGIGIDVDFSEMD